MIKFTCALNNFHTSWKHFILVNFNWNILYINYKNVYKSSFIYFG